MKRLRTLLKRALVAALCICGGLAAGWWLLPRPPAGIADVSYSRQVYDRNGTLLQVTLSDDDKYRIHTPLDQINPELIAATLFLEDRHFHRHPGINPVALLRSAGNLVLGRTGRGGASTISMQLARVRYQLHTRTISGKITQVMRALQIERHYSKREILEAYLNVAPYGRNIEGVGAASLMYFGKSPIQLSAHECVALSVIPQSPTKRTPRVGQENPTLTAAHARLISRLRDAGIAPGVGTDFRPMAKERPRALAPHFTRRILRDAPRARELSSTLDLPLQRVLERRISSYVDSNRRRGIHNAAAMLIDSRSMEVLAQIGSADFHNRGIAGQVDGTAGRRSPGSALKPFIYALAIDQGLIHPLSLLSDAPRAFGHYNPENFDHDFAGPVRAGEALARSRNIPAVTLASQLKQPSLYDLLIRGGVALPKGRNFYGLALPLGGGEVSMEELVRLYAALKNGGETAPLIRICGERRSKAVRLFSPEAAYLTLQMLGEGGRPGLNEPTSTEGIFWKTGTSHGYRDAWSIAVFDHYVLAVWVGNFDGLSNAAFIGRTCAGPLLFSAIDAIRARGGERITRIPPPQGANLRQVTLCAVSGQMPNPYCSHRAEGWFVPGVSPIRTCDIHREILLDASTGLRVTRNDGSRPILREVYEFWPADLRRLFEQAGLPRRIPPPYLPESVGTGSVEALVQSGPIPRIVSPRGGRIVEASTAVSDNVGVPLTADAADGVTKLYWFANQAFVGTAAPRDTVFWKPAPGVYRVTALDDHGRSASRVVTVASPGIN
jgi:penicillin-binding protein 1C